MNDKTFINLSTKDQRMFWKDRVVDDAKEGARNFLVLQFTDSEGTIAKQFQITKKNPISKIDEAREALDLGELDQLDLEQLRVLEEYLEVVDDLNKMRIDQIMSGD